MNALDHEAAHEDLALLIEELHARALSSPDPAPPGRAEVLDTICSVHFADSPRLAPSEAA